MAVFQILGVHLAGAHTRKSAAVRASVSTDKVFSGLEEGTTHQLWEKFLKNHSKLAKLPFHPCEPTPNQPLAPLIWEAYSSEIGPSSHRDSDTRFVEVLLDMGGADIICIDAPLTPPPCVCCALPCPGTLKCPVAETQLLVKLWEQRQSQRDKEKLKRIRLPQPYTDRPWEELLRGQVRHPLWQGVSEFEPVLGSNRAPLTARALHIARQLRKRFPDALLIESHSLLSAFGWSLQAGYKLTSLADLKSAQTGRQARAGLLKRLEQTQLAVRGSNLHPDLFLDFARNPTVFLAAMAAISAKALLSGQLALREDFLSLNQSPSTVDGWACVPKDVFAYEWGH
jgi:hypothetical protein